MQALFRLEPVPKAETETRSPERPIHGPKGRVCGWTDIRFLTQFTNIPVHQYTCSRAEQWYPSLARTLLNPPSKPPCPTRYEISSWSRYAFRHAPQRFSGTAQRSDTSVVSPNHKDTPALGGAKCGAIQRQGDLTLRLSALRQSQWGAANHTGYNRGTGNERPRISPHRASAEAVT